MAAYVVNGRKVFVSLGGARVIHATPPSGLATSLDRGTLDLQIGEDNAGVVLHQASGSTMGMRAKSQSRMLLQASVCPDDAEVLPHACWGDVQRRPTF